MINPDKSSTIKPHKAKSGPFVSYLYEFDTELEFVFLSTIHCEKLSKVCTRWACYQILLTC